MLRMATISDKGFGDTIERFTSFTGIKNIVNAINPDCGCGKRQEWLNDKIPYNKKK